MRVKNDASVFRVCGSKILKHQPVGGHSWEGRPFQRKVGRALENVCYARSVKGAFSRRILRCANLRPTNPHGPGQRLEQNHRRTGCLNETFCSARLISLDEFAGGSQDEQDGRGAQPAEVTAEAQGFGGRDGCVHHSQHWWVLSPGAFHLRGRGSERHLQAALLEGLRPNAGGLVQISQKKNRLFLHDNFASDPFVGRIGQNGSGSPVFSANGFTTLCRIQNYGHTLRAPRLRRAMRFSQK